MAHSTEKLIHSDFKPSILHLNLPKRTRNVSKCTPNVSTRGERCRCSTFCPSLGRRIWKQWSVQYNRPRQLHSLPLSSSKKREKKNKGGVSFSTSFRYSPTRAELRGNARVFSWSHWLPAQQSSRIAQGCYHTASIRSLRTNEWFIASRGAEPSSPSSLRRIFWAFDYQTPFYSYVRSPLVIYLASLHSLCIRFSVPERAMEPDSCLLELSLQRCRWPSLAVLQKTSVDALCVVSANLTWLHCQANVNKCPHLWQPKGILLLKPFGALRTFDAVFEGFNELAVIGSFSFC